MLLCTVNFIKGGYCMTCPIRKVSCQKEQCEWYKRIDDANMCALVKIALLMEQLNKKLIKKQAI